MRKEIDRREFLKLSLLLAGTNLLPQYREPRNIHINGQAKNVLVLVFDTLTATHLSMYGHPRETTPNLNRFAEKATVYHRHFSGGTFTIPGTSSILTGVYPWTHRGLTFSGGLLDEFRWMNMFSLFEQYHRVAYSHNPVANYVLGQMDRGIDVYKPRSELFIDNNLRLSEILSKDFDTASLSMQRILKLQRRFTNNDSGFANSLFLSKVYTAYKNLVAAGYQDEFPWGLPNVYEDDYYLLETTTDYLAETLPDLPEPFLGYFHFLPPHAPYNTRKRFVGAYAGDDWQPVEKDTHIFTKDPPQPYHKLTNQADRYDEFILYADWEFGRLMDSLEEKGVLDDTWVIVTSDHGEMFERGMIGHVTRTMHQPVTWIPLIISAPGQRSRKDVYDVTSSVDVLPTLLHVNGVGIPDWVEGEVLPPYRVGDLPNRGVFAVDSKENEVDSRLEAATGMLVRWPYKFVYYFGYPELPVAQPYFELFNLERDPEELRNLYIYEPGLAGKFLAELQERFEMADKLFG